jgi:hypothetical protein
MLMRRPVCHLCRFLVEPESLKKSSAILEQHNTFLLRHSKSISKQVKQDAVVVDEGAAVADSFAESSAYFKSVDAPAEYGWNALAPDLAKFDAP